MAKRRKNPKRRLRSTAILWLLLIFAASGASYFFKDFRGVRYEWGLVIIWLTASFIAFFVFIGFFALFILPKHRLRDVGDALDLLFHTMTHAAPKPTESPKTAKFPGQETLPVSFEWLNAGILRSHQVLAIKKGTKFAGRKGPGFVRLESGEKIGQALDLRPYVRNRKVIANTIDGIPLAAEISVEFQIRPAPKPGGKFNPVYPNYRSAILQVYRAGSVGKDNKIIAVTHQVAPKAAAIFVSEVARYKLNELSREPSSLNHIQRDVRNKLDTNFDKMGIRIKNVIVTMDDPSNKIVQPRLAYWQAHWKSEIDKEIDKRNKKSAQRMKRIQAEEQVKVINMILEDTHKLFPDFELEIKSEGDNGAERKANDEVKPEPATTLPHAVNVSILEALDEAIAKVMRPPKDGDKDKKDGS